MFHQFDFSRLQWNSCHFTKDIFKYIFSTDMYSNITEFQCYEYPIVNESTSVQVMALNWVNTLRPRQNGRRFADHTFICIFLNENVRISIKISLKFVPKGPINNIPALIQIMAWHRSGDKPLSKPMMVSLLTYICVTRPQWVNICQWKVPKSQGFWTGLTIPSFPTSPIWKDFIVTHFNFNFYLPTWKIN